MKRVKLFLSVAALAGMTALMGIGSAEAGIAALGKVTYIDDTGATGSGGVYIYTMPLSPSATPSTVVSYCSTTSTAQVINAAAAAAGRLTVRLWANGSTATSGYLGTCTYVDVFPNN